MTTSLPPRKSVKWGRLIPGGVLSVLVIAMALLWFAYQKDPASVARYGINIGHGGRSVHRAIYRPSSGFGFFCIASRTQSPTSG